MKRRQTNNCSWLKVELGVVKIRFKLGERSLCADCIE
jgi:hypothetical protein